MPPSDNLASAIARALLDGFDKHYRLFREVAIKAKQRFERADWLSQQRSQRDRIDFYDQRVLECVQQLEQAFHASQLPMDVWQEVKLRFIGLLISHHQPECAETFFNSVTCKILQREYFHNDFIFIRPAVSTEYLENVETPSQPTYRCHYPAPNNLRAHLRAMIESFGLQRPFANLDRDIVCLEAALLEALGARPWRTSFQIQVLSSLFFRNKGAYVVAKVINGDHVLPLAIPILHNEDGKLYLDAALTQDRDILALFSFARAYFLVDMEVPSAYVQFLSSLMPRRSRGELYNAVGLQKQGKTLFYRDLLLHLRHSGDQFVIAPGIEGMVMLVFTLPSFPFVFKLIKDNFPPQKEITREQIKAKYLLVKQHDRVGRMADSLEFSNVALPFARFDEAVIAALQRHCASLLEENGEEIIIRHCYIERRLTPLNLYLQEADETMLEQSIIEYGNAIKDLVAANIFPGDMLWKNFGVTRGAKVVFYDYDEIEYITDCQFRKVPPAPNEEYELSGEPWYSVGPRDVFPETFDTFLLGDPKVRRIFLAHHADLLDANYWSGQKARIEAGQLIDVFPYEQSIRFQHRYANQFGASPAPVASTTPGSM